MVLVSVVLKGSLGGTIQVVNMLVIGLVFGQNLMVISTMGILLCKSISPLLCIMRVHFCCLYINYIVYKHLKT